MGESQGLGGAAEELLELEVETEVAVIHGQLPDRRAGELAGWGGKASEEAGGALGGERRIAGEQFIGAVAAEDDLDLLAGEPAQEVRGQDRGVAERLVEPGGDFGQEFEDCPGGEDCARGGRCRGVGRRRGRGGSRRSWGPRNRWRRCGRSEPVPARRAPRRRSTNRPRRRGRRPGARRSVGGGRRSRGGGSQNRSAVASKSESAGEGRGGAQ